MNRKGFTLVELIGIISIFACIFLVSFPSLKSMTIKENQKAYESMIYDLCAAGKSYIYSNIEKYPELNTIDQTINIKIEELIEYGNVNKRRKNPKSKLSVKYSSLKYTVLDDYSLSCIYIE